MPNYTVRDLGAGFYPMSLNNRGDVVGYEYAGNPNKNVCSVHFADDTVLMLPPDIFYLVDISDDGLVLMQYVDGKPVLFDTTTLTIEPINIPGFPFIVNVSMDDLGNLAGTVKNGPEYKNLRGFVQNRSTQQITLVAPTNMPLPSGAIPFLRLSGRNIHGHAVGSQGWTEGNNQLSVSIFYDGLGVSPFGNYAELAGGGLITNNDLVLAGIYPRGAAEYELIYNAKTNTLTTYTDRRIINLNSKGKMLWAIDLYGETYLTSATGTTIPLDDVFPAGSHWSNVSGWGLNDANAICGHGIPDVGGLFHGYLLQPELMLPKPKKPRVKIDDIIATILWGVINDAGGIQIIGGKLSPVPPRAPIEQWLGAFPEPLRSNLTAAIDYAKLDDITGSRLFSSEVRNIVENYQRDKWNEEG